MLMEMFKSIQANSGEIKHLPCYNFGDNFYVRFWYHPTHPTIRENEDAAIDHIPQNQRMHSTDSRGSQLLFSPSLAPRISNFVPFGTRFYTKSAFYFFLFSLTRKANEI